MNCIYNLHVLFGKLQRVLQPLKLAGWIRNVHRYLIGAVVKVCVQTHQPKSRLNQLRVKAPCCGR